jgi:hypothetical protein
MSWVNGWQASEYLVESNKTMRIPNPREIPMNAVRVETTVEADGELHLTELPCRRGDKVEAIVLILDQDSRPIPDVAWEKTRAEALAQFLALARSSSFRSDGAYPTRDDLHDRH